MIRAFDTNKEENLEAFGQLLWQRKISHIIQEAGDRKIVAVARPDQVNQTLDLYRQWASGEIKPEESNSSDFSSYFSGSEFVANILRAFMLAPLILTLILVCIVLFVLTLSMGNIQLFNALLYPDFTHGSTTFHLQSVLDNFEVVQFLKMISPILLHGGYLHLIFNMLWLWEFGKRIEAKQSSWILLFVIVFMALCSNTTQYVITADHRFVGISGVVYGLLGYLWMWQWIDPAKGIRIQPSLIVMMLIMLAVMTFINFSMIADEAHIAGLLSGVFIGGLLAIVSRFRRSQQSA